MSILRIPHRYREAFRTVSTIATAAAIVLTARSSLADHYRVPSGSMLPTVHVGDHVLVDKAAYGLRLPLTHTYVVPGAEPGRGDVVVLESPETGIVLLKRVVGLPGDRLEVRSGRIWIDGRPAAVEAHGDDLVETLGGREHPVELGADGGPDFGPVTVPAGSYLVLGDSRGNSRDGRSFGWASREAILGRAVRVLMRDGVPVWLPL